MQKALPITSWSMALSQEMNTHFHSLLSGYQVQQWKITQQHMIRNTVTCLFIMFQLLLFSHYLEYLKFFLLKKKDWCDVELYNLFLLLKIRYHTLLSFSPSLWGIRDFKLWKPALMLCILRLSLLLAISLLIFFSFSICALPGTDCDLQDKWKI